MTETFSGGCLCEAVRYECGSAPVVTGHCQCVDCRKSSGSGHCSHIGVPKQAVTITGKLSAYDRPADSGNLVSRLFCPNCGAPVYSTNSSMPDLLFIRASSLDDPEVFKPQVVVYASRAPSWDRLDPDLPSFATMPEGGPEEIIRDSSG
jgi:hypothetical protein